MNNDALKSVMMLGVAVLAIGGGLVYWQWSARSEASGRVAALEAQLPDGQQLQAHLDKATSELADYQSQLNHLERGVPSSAYVPTLLKELEMVGDSNQISVNGVRPVQNFNADENEVEKPYKELEIDIVGQGSYPAVMNLIASLQKFPKILSVVTVGLAPRKDVKTTTAELDATVRLKAFIFKDAEKDLEETPEEGSGEVASAGSGVKSL